MIVLLLFKIFYYLYSMRDAIHIFIFILTILLVGIHANIAFASHDNSLIELVSFEFESETEVEAEFEYISADINNAINLIVNNTFYNTMNVNGIELADVNTPPPE